jgi:hypothetical protein
MLDLARQYGQGSVYLREIAAREDISEKYLSQIIIPLRGGGLVRSIRGLRDAPVHLPSCPYMRGARHLDDAGEKDIRSP